MTEHQHTAPDDSKIETATFGAGCFWGVELTFMGVPGVLRTEVGYAGGSLGNPSYRDVCGGNTGHAEVVQVHFDPRQVSYGQLLDVFWDCHDPSQLNRQGPDVGTQYRSVIFYHSAEQQAAAEASKTARNASKAPGRPIVTAIESASSYWPAEGYHQKYLRKRGYSACGTR